MKEFIIKNKVLVIVLSIVLVGAVIGGSILVISLNNDDSVKEVDKGKENSKQESTSKEENSTTDSEPSNEDEILEDEPVDNKEETNNSKPENKPSTNKPSTNQPTPETNTNKEETNKNEENKTDSNTSSNTGSNTTVNNNTNNKEETKEENKEETPKVEEEQPKEEEEPVKKSKTYLDCKYQNDTKTMVLTYNFIWDEYNKMTTASQDTSTVFDFSPFNDTQIETIEAGHKKVCTEFKNIGALDCKYTRRADGYSITIYHNVNTLAQTTDGLLNSSMDANTVKNKLNSTYNNKMTCTIK